ncbi:MAG: hypothetical protein NVV74_08800 [Magnetospirillum sp.]|nr:hypothetical protein [Magnetospirillum sp.]
MTEPLSGYDFIIQISESFANRLITALMASGTVKTSFHHAEGANPGLLRSRTTATGRIMYQNLLVELDFGYEIAISQPRIRFITGADEHTELSLDFALEFPRELTLRRFAPVGDSPLADDPKDVKVSVDYEVVHGSSPYPPQGSSPVRGSLVIALPIETAPFESGVRVSVATGRASRQAVATVIIDVQGMDPRLERFLGSVASKIISEILRREIDGIDLTAMVGALDVFGLATRPPMHLRIAQARAQRALGIGFHERGRIGDGNPAAMPFILDGQDFSLQMAEGFFVNTMTALYDDGVLPRKFGYDGKPDPEGDILIEVPRFRFRDGTLGIVTRIDLVGRPTGPTVVLDADIRLVRKADQLLVEVVRLDINVGIPALDPLTLLMSVLFNVLDVLIDHLFASLLRDLVDSSLKQGLDEFLRSGALAFGFRSPVRGGLLSVELAPFSFVFLPGAAVLTGALSVVPKL